MKKKRPPFVANPKLKDKIKLDVIKNAFQIDVNPMKATR